MNNDEKQEYILLAHELKRIMQRMERLVELAVLARQEDKRMKLVQADGYFQQGINKLGEIE